MISARKGAPSDGTGKGEIPTSPNAYSRSKQNSDASGMMYQWGRKEPFKFASSSLKWGTSDWNYGKYPVKIYNDKLELIYQNDTGSSNDGKTPIGGLVYQSMANSTMETVKKPNLFYWGNGGVINQVGHSKELWDYYWTSNSRGTDGKHNPNINVSSTNCN